MKYIFSLFLLFLIINSACAQDSSKSCFEARNGLQFQIGTSFTIRNFNNYTFSYRYRFNRNAGLRIGILVSISKDDYDITQQADSISINPPYTNIHNNLKFSVQYLYNLVRNKDFSFFLGGGPFISYSNSDSKYYYLYTQYQLESKDKEKYLGYGLDILSGIEYSLTQNIIISGEYGLSLTKGHTDTETYDRQINSDHSPDNIRKRSGTVNSFEITGMGVNFGIAVFF